jgi:hypothetical protein
MLTALPIYIIEKYKIKRKNLRKIINILLKKNTILIY